MKCRFQIVPFTRLIIIYYNEFGKDGNNNIVKIFKPLFQNILSEINVEKTTEKNKWEIKKETYLDKQILAHCIQQINVEQNFLNLINL